MKKFLMTLFVCSLFSQAFAQINLDDVLYSGISSTTRLKQREEHQLLLNTKVIKYSRIKSIEYTIDAGEANVLTDKLVFLPEQYVVNYYSNKNCSDGRRGWTQNLVLKVTQGQSFKITNSIKSSKKTSYSLGFKLPIPKIGLELSGSTSTEVTFETSSSQEVQRTITSEETISKTISFDVDSKKQLFVKFQTIKYALRVPFEATLRVNGYVVVQNVTRIELGGDSHEGVTEENIPLASLLNAEQRTFSITGFLENSKAGKEDVEYAEINLPVDSCDQTPTKNPFIAITEKLDAKKTLTKEEIQILRTPNQVLLKKDLNEGKVELEETVKKLNLKFQKNQ